MSQNNSKRSAKKGLFEHFCYDFVKITGLPSALIWMRPKIHYPFGKPNTGGRLMVISNHPTFIDPIIVQLVFPFRRLYSLATKDIFKNKIKAILFTLMHCIIVDKDNFSMTSFHEVQNCLNNGHAVVIFPEGQVNHNVSDQPIMAFKSGAVLMAHRAKAYILPMYIVKSKKWYHRQNVVMGQPVDVAEMLGAMPSMQKLTELNDYLRDREVELKEYYESVSSK